MKTRALLAIASVSFSLAASIQAQTVVWTNTVSGTWNTAANWSPNTVPGSNNLAIINQSGVTVSLNGATSAGGIVLGTNSGTAVTLAIANQVLTLYGPLTVNSSGSFTVANGTLTGSTNAVLNGAIGWSGGTLTGALTLSAAGTLAIAGGTMNINGCLLTNNGTVNWASGTIQGGNGAVIYNNTLWNILSDQTFNNALGGASANFNNYGTVRKSGGAGPAIAYTSFSGVVFNQLAGAIDVQNGTNGLELALQGGGNFSGGYVATNSNGLVVLSVGNFNLNGTVTTTNTLENSGFLVGDNVLQGALIWNAGNWNNAASVTIATNCTLVMAGGAGDLNMSACQVTNNGTVAWVSGRIEGGNATAIYNYGLWDMQSDQTFNNAYGGAGTTFNNYGNARKSGGAGPAIAYSLFSNVTFNQLAGVLDVQNGTNGLELALQGGGNFTGGYVTTNQSGLTILSIGSFTVNGTVTSSNTIENSGNLIGTNVINGVFTWAGGNWNSAISVTVNPNASLVLAGTGDLNMSACQTTNDGTIVWISGRLEGGNGTAIYNNGLWDMQIDQTFNNAYGGAGTSFYNSGTVRKSAGAGEFAGSSIFDNVAFNQQAGAIDVQNGIGTNGLQLSFRGGGKWTGGYVTTNQYGLTTLSAGAFTINGAVTGANTWENGGTLTGTNVFRGALTWQSGSWASTINTVTASSTLIIDTRTDNHLLNNTTLTNNGTVIWRDDTLYAGNSSHFYNYGLWNMQDDHTLLNYYGGAGAAFDNYGTFQKSGGVNTNQTVVQGVNFNQNSGLIDVQTGNLNFVSGVENFLGGSTTSTGAITLASGSFTIAGTLTTSNLTDNGAAMVGTNAIAGALTWQAGAWSAAIATVTSNSTVYINTASGTHLLNNTTLTNYGTITWLDDTLYAGNSSHFYNYGLWNMQDDHTLLNYYGGAGAAFDNYGTLQKSGGVSSNQTVFQGVNFNQDAGLMDVQAGNLNFVSSVANLIGGSTTSTGTINLASGSYTVNGTLTTSNVVNNGATMVGINIIHGALTWVSGPWPGAIATVAPSSVLYINTASGNHLLNATTLTNYGTVNWNDDILYSGNNAAFYNFGVWNALNDQVFQNYYGGAGIMFSNLGSFRKIGGTNSTRLQSGLTFNNTGTLDSQIGNISLEGAYTLTNGTLNFGLNSLSNYGTITLTGAAILGGTVSANLNGGYQPIGGNSFTNLYYGSFTGAFTNAVLPFLDAWTTNYTPTAFYLHVLNARPTLNPVATQTVNELTLLTVTNTATDPDLPAQGLAYSIVSGPVGLTINSATGVITWTPAQTNSPSTNTVVVAVTDNGVPALSVTNSFVVIVKEVNVAPTLPSIPAQTVNVLGALSVTNTASEFNIHSTTIGYRLVGAPPGATISSNGIITWTPMQAQGPGTNFITTIVTNFNQYDLVNSNLTATNSFQVVVYAPTLVPISNYTVGAGQTVSLIASAYDNDPTRTLTFSLGAAPVGATINSSTGAFTWRAGAAYGGTANTVQVRVAANSSPSDTVTQSFTITVNPYSPVSLTAVSKTAAQFQLQANGPVGPDYILQGATSLSPTNWVNLLTNTPSSSPFTITTTNVNATNEYYRVQLAP